MLVSYKILDNLRTQCKSKKLFDYVKFLDGHLSEYDSQFKLLLKKYGELSKDLEMYFVSTKSDKYEEFSKNFSELQKIEIDIDEDYYNKMTKDSFFNE